MSKKLRIRVKKSGVNGLYECRYNGMWIGTFFTNIEGSLTLSKMLEVFCNEQGIPYTSSYSNSFPSAQ